MKQSVLTQEMIVKYKENGLVLCPFCDSEDIEGGFVEINEGSAEQRIICNECNEVWIDVYKFETIIGDI